MVTWTVCKILDILTFSPYKCLCYQIWPWPKIGQDHPRVIIWTNYDGPPVPNASYQILWKSAQWFQRRKFLKGFYHIWTWQLSWSCDPRFGSLNVSYHKEQEYIWFRDGDPNGLHILWSKGGGASPGEGLGPWDHWSVPLNASCHKDQEYI